jgi:hypothetical protein
MLMFSDRLSGRARTGEGTGEGHFRNFQSEAHQGEVGRNQ